MFTDRGGPDLISGQEYESETDYGYLPRENVIPEPTTIMLMIVGAVALAGKRN